MYILSVFFITYVTAVSSVSVTLQNSTCSSSYSQFQCSDGGCVPVTAVCDGKTDCDDASDEASCDDVDVKPSGGHQIDEGTALTRHKRQTQCNKSQWRCNDGTCISFDGKCDGIKDCPDGSDETFPLCRKNQCLPHWFRCAYGACVDGTAPCNGVQECADNSDELLPACRNVTEMRGSFRCDDGSKIPAYQHCDGARDCADGSDETLRACAGKSCADYLFQCAYGACVDANSDCNGVEDCADGSDESDELCRKNDPSVTTKPSTTGACVLPPYPAHGSYVVAGVPSAKPGQAFDTVAYNVTCHPGYGLVGQDKARVCYGGIWIGDVGPCVRFCPLKKDDSVEYLCVLTDGSSGTRPCGEYEPDGTIVEPRCRTPNYYYNGVLGYMHCIGGSWDYVARCTPGLIITGTADVDFDNTDGINAILNGLVNNIVTINDIYNGTGVIFNGSNIIVNGNDVIFNRSNVFDNGSDVIFNGTNVVLNGSDVIFNGTNFILNGIDVLENSTVLLIDSVDLVFNDSNTLKHNDIILTNFTEILRNATIVSNDGTNIIFNFNGSDIVFNASNIIVVDKVNIYINVPNVHSYSNKVIFCYALFFVVIMIYLGNKIESCIKNRFFSPKKINVDVKSIKIDMTNGMKGVKK